MRRRYGFLFVFGAAAALPGAGEPGIEALSPCAASPGGSVTVIGRDFGSSPGAVVLAGLRIAPDFWSETAIIFTVPWDGASGLLRVRDARGTASDCVGFAVERAAAPGQYGPDGLAILDTGLPGAAFLVETDGSFLYGVSGFETLWTYELRPHGPHEFRGRIYLPQRVGDLRVRAGYLFCAGDHGLLIYRCADLQAGKTAAVAAVAGGSFLAVDVKEKAGNPVSGMLVALAEYLPAAGGGVLRVPLYEFAGGELVRLGVFERPAGATERQHAVAVDPQYPKVYVSGYETLFGSDKYILEIDVADPASPALLHREELGATLAFDMDARGSVLWVGIVATGTTLFQQYALAPGAGHIALRRTVEGAFALGRTTRVSIVDDAVTVGSAWLGSRPDVFLLGTQDTGTEPRAAADSIDWAFDVAGFAEGPHAGKVLVADEWGGFMTYRYSAAAPYAIEHEQDYHAIISSCMTEGLHLAGDRIYIANRGAGAWSADRFDLADRSRWRSVAWDWAQPQPQPHPVSALRTRRDPEFGTLIAALGHEKAMAWGRLVYGLLYVETDHDISLLATSEAIDPPGIPETGVDVIWPEEDLVFMTTGSDGFRAFVIDPRRPSITIHGECRTQGFGAGGPFGTANPAVCMAALPDNGARKIAVGSAPGPASQEPALRFFDVAYPAGAPSRLFPDRSIVVGEGQALACTKHKPVRSIALTASGCIAAATDQGVILFDVAWVPELNLLPDVRAWNLIKIPGDAFRPWWDQAWDSAFADARFADADTLYAVKTPRGVWRLDFALDPAAMAHTCTANAFYPGVQCGMDYTRLLDGWTNPDIVTLHHPYGVAADGHSAYVTGWSGKVQRLFHAADNRPPDPPLVHGPARAGVLADCAYGVEASDPDGDPLSYVLEWGDGTAVELTARGASGRPAEARHRWTAAGEFEIKAAARDYNGAQGAWTSLRVEILCSCGDCNVDGTVDIADAVTLLAHLFRGGALPGGREAADVNSDAVLDISDAVFLLLHLFVDYRELCVRRA